MSFIMFQLKCEKCGDEMNVADGTFGYGVPKKCPTCGSDKLVKIADGWKHPEFPSPTGAEIRSEITPSDPLY